MDDELVDILDESGRQVRVDSKHTAHADGLLHAVVIGTVQDAAGNRVLVRQAADRQDAGQFVNPVGGHVRAGEALEDALRREVAEEIGWNNFTFSKIGAKIFNRMVIGRKENHVFHVFAIASDEPIRLNAESVEVRAFAPNEHRQLVNAEPGLFGDAHHFVMQAFPELF